MPEHALYIGNRNYSSWSLRAWMACKQAGIAFKETVIPLRRPETREMIARYAPSGRVPVLMVDDRVVWDSLGICEYLNETYPRVKLWPKDKSARVMARCVVAEMHADFNALRRSMPMNVRGHSPGQGMNPDVQTDINRITAIWRDCLNRFGDGDNGFLFGSSLSIPDIFFAPVVTRFYTYGVDLEPVVKAYADRLWEHPYMREWRDAAAKEPWYIPEFEI